MQQPAHFRDPGEGRRPEPNAQSLTERQPVAFPLSKPECFAKPEPKCVTEPKSHGESESFPESECFSEPQSVGQSQSLTQRESFAEPERNTDLSTGQHFDPTAGREWRRCYDRWIHH